MEQKLPQIPISSLSKQTWEVVVIGSGPAGAVCAGILAKYGHEVLIIDKKQFPREKACGDLLLADSQDILKSIHLFENVRQAGNHIATIRVFSPSQHVFDAPGTYYALRRKELDFLLTQQACLKNGAAFAHGAVTAIEPGNGSSHAVVRVHGINTVSVRGKIIVIATGGVAHLPYTAGLIESREPYAIALRGYVRSDYHLKEVIISYDISILPGYGWIVPLGADTDGCFLYNIGCGRRNNRNRRSLKQIYQMFLSTFPLARDIIAAGEQPQHIQGAPLRCNLPVADKKQQGNILAIGEAIGTTFPFTGEGVGTAMQSGKIAADVIHDTLHADDLTMLGHYTQRVNETLKPLYASYKKAERWLSYSWLNDFVAQRIASSAYLQRELQQVIAADTSPDSLFGVKSLLLSFFK